MELGKGSRLIGDLTHHLHNEYEIEGAVAERKPTGFPHTRGGVEAPSRVRSVRRSGSWRSMEINRPPGLIFSAAAAVR